MASSLCEYGRGGCGFSEEAYDSLIAGVFSRHQSFQTAGSDAYKPGLDRMLFFDQLLGRPHTRYRTVHVAGTNGKGSVSNMIAAALSAAPLDPAVPSGSAVSSGSESAAPRVSARRVGLYTSPHLVDFRERIRLVEDGRVRLISRREVWDFLTRWADTIDNLGLSFFEITTAMAFDWFAGQGVDTAVVECGLGGRLDSTNIISPVLSVITNIGLDHCDILGESLAEIAYEKAGIIKPRTPVVVGESNPQTDQVFERKVLYTNLPEPCFGGSRERIASLLHFADRNDPPGWDLHASILAKMDLAGPCQVHNLRTVLTALQVLGNLKSYRELFPLPGKLLPEIVDAICRTASLMEFHGRWERISESPVTICDIGHNEHGLRYNFARLDELLDAGQCSDLIIVYGSVADKDFDAVLKLLPSRAHIIFTEADSRRAMPAVQLEVHFKELGLKARSVRVMTPVARALSEARGLAEGMASPLIYVGGSTYVVSEAVSAGGPH